MRLLVQSLVFTALLASVSCSRDGVRHGQFKAYLYKQPEKDGLLCIFYSSYAGIAEQNAQLFATLHKEKYGVPLIVRTEPY